MSVAGKVPDDVSARLSRFPGVHPPLGEESVRSRVYVIHVVSYLALAQCPCPYPGLRNVSVESTASGITCTEIESSGIVTGQVYGLACNRYARSILSVDVDRKQQRNYKFLSIFVSLTILGNVEPMRTRTDS